TAFRQQRLKAWQCHYRPILTPKTVLPLFFAIGIIFAPIGGVLLWASSQLTNFYQNHRRYAKSFSTDQLSGKAVSASSIDGSDCTPLTVETINAGLPTFSKLAQRNDSAIMKAGTYTVDIDHHFNVTEYGGTKSIIISTRTVMGGKNPFLGIAYVVVGGICIVLGTLFTVTHLIKPRKLGDHTYLSWNNEQSTATTSGRDGGMGNGEGHS
ncbi:Lem3/Cdc50, partial [Diplocarpon rosae]